MSGECTHSDELRDLCYDFAGDLAQAEPDVTQWAAWLQLLLEALEGEAFERALDPAMPAGVELAFERLRDALSDRLQNGRW